MCNLLHEDQCYENARCDNDPSGLDPISLERCETSNPSEQQEKCKEANEESICNVLIHILTKHSSHIVAVGLVIQYFSLKNEVFELNYSEQVLSQRVFLMIHISINVPRVFYGSVFSFLIFPISPSPFPISAPIESSGKAKLFEQKSYKA